jgi:acetyl esterase/lipase
MWPALVVLAAGLAAGAEEQTPYRQTLNVVYAEQEGVGLIMDVFAPTQSGGPGKLLGIVCVTSGAWGSDRSMVEAHRKVGLFDILCGHGYTVFAVRPGSVTSFTAEQMLSHIGTGIRYIKAHATEYGIDSERLGMVGVSAGGHLACLAATRADPANPNAKDPLGRFDTRVRAVGVFCPAADFLDWGGKKYGLDLMQWRLVFRDGVAGKTEQQKDDAAKAISPIYHVKPGLPPVLFIHGDADSLIPLQQSEKMVKELRAAGDSAELIIKQGGDHSWPTVREEIEKMAQWFDARLSAR